MRSTCRPCCARLPKAPFRARRTSAGNSMSGVRYAYHVSYRNCSQEENQVSVVEKVQQGHILGFRLRVKPMPVQLKLSGNTTTPHLWHGAATQKLPNVQPLSPKVMKPYTRTCMMLPHSISQALSPTTLMPQLLYDAAHVHRAAPPGHRAQKPRVVRPYTPAASPAV